jgi:hypothetical protein
VPLVFTQQLSPACANLTIVTFNYDRSVEHFLFTALQNTYNLTDTEAADATDQINIIHVHGRLGAPQWKATSAYRRAYKPDVSIESIKQSAVEIKIIHEPDAANDPEFTRARQAIAASKRLLFLGFGYHKTNLERLVPATGIPISWIFGSGFGLMDGERATAAGLIKTLQLGKLHLGISNHNALDYLRTLPLASW